MFDEHRLSFCFTATHLSLCIFWELLINTGTSNVNLMDLIKNFGGSFELRARTAAIILCFLILDEFRELKPQKH